MNEKSKDFRPHRNVILDRHEPDHVISGELMQRINRIRESAYKFAEERNADQLKLVIKAMSKIFATEVKQLTEVEGIPEFCEFLVKLLATVDDPSVVKSIFGCIANVIHSGPSYSEFFLKCGILQYIQHELVDVRDDACDLRCYAILANMMDDMKPHETELKQIIDFDHLFEVAMVKPEKYYETVLFLIEKLAESFDLGDNLIEVIDFLADLTDVARGSNRRKRCFMFTKIVRVLSFLITKRPHLLMIIWEAKIIQTILQFMDEDSFTLPGEIFDFLDCALTIVRENQEMTGVTQQIIREISVREIVDLATGKCPSAMPKGTALIVKLINWDIVPEIIEDRNENGLMALMFYLMDAGKTEVFAIKIHIAKFLCVIIDKLGAEIVREREMIEGFVQFVDSVGDGIEDGFLAELLMVLAHVIEHCIADGDEATAVVFRAIAELPLATALGEIDSPLSGPIAAQIGQLMMDYEKGKSG